MQTPLNGRKLSYAAQRQGSLRYCVCLGACWLILAGSNLRAATSTASSPNYDDVATAVKAAAVGDIVYVPAGAATWTSTLAIDKAITLVGAGSNETFITNAVPKYQPLITFGLLKGKSFRVSGFYFDCNWDKGGGAIAAYTRGYQDAWKNLNYIDGFRIDNCVFDRCWYFNGAGAAPLDMWGRVFGVVDHCDFVDGVYAARIFGNPISEAQADAYGWQNDTSGTADWEKMPAPYYYLGSTNNFVMEDCVIRTRNPAYSPPPTTSRLAISSAWTAHYVFRYNIVTNGFYDGFNDVLDLHGNKAVDGSYRGAVCFECYGNKVYSTYNAYRLAYLRGGTCMVFSNQVYGVGSKAGSIVLEEEELWNDVGPVKSTWPAMDQITNSFFWGNTINGQIYNAGPSSEVEKAVPGFFKVGRDYWLNAPTATNVLKDYQPLTYPHPLVKASPIPPALLRVQPPK